MLTNIVELGFLGGFRFQRDLPELFLTFTRHGLMQSLVYII
jgi:hypothetical protein